MKEALVLMAEAPIQGQVKTQLFDLLSPEDATELYVAFLNDTVRAMEEIYDEREELSLVLCYRPEGAEEAFEQVEREGSLMLLQRGQTLTERIRNCFTDLFKAGFEAVVIAGADTPTLPADAFYEALEQLNENTNRVVIGPTDKGSVYLIGLHHTSAKLLDELHLEGSDAIAQISQQVQTFGRELSLLPEWYSVNNPDEFERLKADVSSNKTEARRTQKFFKMLAKRTAT
ncbi:MAG TPA: DUF2064 domain-containing protein [Blastocatellia bacterium]|nr:DUF2064 domain-containing protein [Blastocatellia bacterium]